MDSNYFIILYKNDFPCGVFENPITMSRELKIPINSIRSAIKRAKKQGFANFEYYNYKMYLINKKEL